MKRAVLVLAILLFVASTTYAEDKFTSTVSSRVWSKYLTQGGGALTKDPVLQTDVFILSPWGFYFDAWQSAGLDGTGLNSDFGDEVGYYIGWIGNSGKAGFNLGVAYIDLYKLFGSPKNDFTQIFGETNYSFNMENHSIVPFFRLEYTMAPFGTASDPTGSVRSLSGVGHSWALNSKLGLNHKLWIIYDDGKLIGEAATIGQYQAGLIWKISNRFDVELPTVKFSVPITNTHDSRKSESVIGAGIVFRF